MDWLNFALSAVLGLVAIGLIASLSLRFEERIFPNMIVRQVLFGFGVAFANSLAETAPILVVVAFYILSLLGMVYLMFWWKKEGSDWIEFLQFLILGFFVCMDGSALAQRISLDTDVHVHIVLKSVIVSLPPMLYAISLGFFIANMMWFKQKMSEYSDAVTDEP